MMMKAMHMPKWPNKHGLEYNHTSISTTDSFRFSTLTSTHAKEPIPQSREDHQYSVLKPRWKRTYIAFVRGFYLTVSRLLASLNVLVRVLGGDVLGSLEIGDRQYGRTNHYCNKLTGSKPPFSPKALLRYTCQNPIGCHNCNDSPCPVKQRFENTWALSVLARIERHDRRDVGVTSKGISTKVLKRSHKDSPVTLGKDTETPLLVIGKDEVIATESLGCSVLSGPIPGSLGLGVVVVRALHTRINQSGVIRVPHIHCTHVYNQLLPVIVGEGGRVDGPDDQLDFLGLAFVDQEELSGA
jgi:hypothetical protein